MHRLAIISTHPIQYYAPFFQKLAERGRLDIRVFFGWRGASENATHDPGFGQDVQWDIPLLDGYAHTFVENTAHDPGTHHFFGLVNPDLIPKIDDWQPDAVLVFGWGWWGHLRALYHFSGRVPVFFRGDSTLLDEQPGFRMLLRRLFLHWVYRYVDVALYVGQHNRAYFRKHGLRDEQLVWAPHAVENTRFYDEDGTYQQQAEAWRSQLGISDDAIAFVFAGKLDQKKDPLSLLNAFLALEAEDAHLVLAGSGPQEEELKQRADENRRVHFIGFQNQSKMPVVYRLGDVFVLPSRSETWGLAVNEAMACGRPVVISDRVGCAPDLVDDENGAIVPAGNPLALRQTLEEFLRDEDRLQEMGQCSAERISDWTIEEAAVRTEEAVQSVLN
ncbi:glycosyltransferase family 4 protein [Salinibacter ruber]|uniref:glycosyltransferase family 4 protein n=1 Tax=Salinibacter ruber TaxID=146919 RepID=UPI0020744D4D|nr:glycosyltransferase family 4 protein [Salinibacter ruber]